MSSAGPVRFYIVHTAPGQAPIVVPQYVRDSPLAIVQERWTTALPELAKKYPHRGESLEIDSHGLPGMLLLDPVVAPHNLPHFAAAAAGLLRPSARVEFLACKVAGYKVDALLDILKRKPGRDADVRILAAFLGLCDDIENDYDQKLQLTPKVQQLIDAGQFVPDGPAKPISGPSSAGGSRGLVFGPKPLPGRGLSLTSAAGNRPKLNRAALDYTRVAQLAINSGMVRIGGFFNGPLFCSQAARAFRCPVRAAMGSQSGDISSGMGLDEFVTSTTYRPTQYGNWQGLVFDFLPNGTAKYLGLDLVRPIFIPMDAPLA